MRVGDFSKLHKTQKENRRRRDNALLAQKISGGCGVLGFFAGILGTIFLGEYYDNISIPFMYGVYSMMGMLAVGMVLGLIIGVGKNKSSNSG